MPMSLLLPGVHVPVDTPIHRLDPRVKMSAALVLMAMPFAAPSPFSNLLLVALVIAVARLSAAPLVALLRTLRTVFWLGFFMFFFYLFSTPGEPLMAWQGVTVTWAGILRGATQIYRLCLLVVVSSLLTFTTSPAQLAHGFETVLGPFARLGFPLRELALVLTIALRFVPTLFDQIDKITKAQRARGADFHSWQPWRRVRAWVPTFVPIFVAAFRRADHLATAMEARGFRGARHRTHLHQLRLTRRDLMASLAVLIASLAMIALSRSSWPGQLLF
jgi:energy-coupling factor transport system permease protein